MSKQQRALEYVIVPMTISETKESMPEYASASEIPFRLAFGTEKEPNKMVEYQPNVMYPYTIWYQDANDVYWHCYHMFLNFCNYGFGVGSTNEELTKMLNTPDGKKYFLSEVEKEFNLRSKHQQLTFDESKFYDVAKERFSDKYTVKIIPLVMNLHRDNIFEHRNSYNEKLRPTVKFTLDKRLLYEDESYKWDGFAGEGLHHANNAKIGTDLYSFAVHYETDNTTWFYNIFWDDTYNEDVESYMDELLTDETGEKWVNFLNYNPHAPVYISQMAVQKQGRVLGIFPVYIDFAVMVDGKILKLNYDAWCSKTSI